jgi:hypothetical protein
MVAGMIQPPEPWWTTIDGRKLGLEARAFLCALFGLVDLSLPGEAVGGEVKITVAPEAPPAPEPEK